MDMSKLVMEESISEIRVKITCKSLEDTVEPR